MAEWFAQLASTVESPLQSLWQLALAGVSLFTVGHVLLHKRNPRPATMWVVVCLALPGLGALAYWMFGFNRISTRTRALRDRWPVSATSGFELRAVLFGAAIASGPCEMETRPIRRCSKPSGRPRPPFG